MTKIYLKRKTFISNSGITTAITILNWISLFSIIGGIGYSLYSMFTNILYMIGFGWIPFWWSYSLPYYIGAIIWCIIQIVLGIVALILFLPIFKKIKSGNISSVNMTKLWIAAILGALTYYGIGPIVLIIFLYINNS